MDAQTPVHRKGTVVNTQYINAKETETPVRRMRTIKGLSEYYRELDPLTAITEHFIRQLVRERKIPITYAGTKVLIAIEDMDEFLANPARAVTHEFQHGQIRRI